MADVSTEDVLPILQKDELWTKKTETATRVRSRVELVLSYAKALKMRQGENPAAWRGHLDALLPKPTKLKKVRQISVRPTRSGAARARAPPIARRAEGAKSMYQLANVLMMA